MDAQSDPNTQKLARPGSTGRPILKRRAETPRPPRPVRRNRLSGLKRSDLVWLGRLSDNSHHSRTRASFSRNHFFDFAWILASFPLQTPTLFWRKIMDLFGLFWLLAWPGLPWPPLASPWPPFGVPWPPLGRPLASLGVPLATLWLPFGGPWRPFGASLAPLSVSWRVFSLFLWL